MIVFVNSVLKHMEHAPRTDAVPGRIQFDCARHRRARGRPVVNFDIHDEMDPAEDAATFMHRVGRTGRFGAKSVCINLMERDNESAFRCLEVIRREYALDIEQVEQDSKALEESIAKWLAE